jgi:mannitol-1-/sugar-/sorbitol-6-phosphatase
VSGRILQLEPAALLFDMDGVLLDSSPVVERTWRRWAARHGVSADPFLRIAHGRRTWDTLRIAAPALATKEEVAWLDAVELEDLEGVRPVPGAEALLAALSSGQWTVVTAPIDRCLVVEDAPAGIEAGRAAEARVLAVATTHAVNALTAADYIVSDLRSVHVSPHAAGLSIQIEVMSPATGAVAREPQANHGENP